MINLKDWDYIIDPETGRKYFIVRFMAGGVDRGVAAELLRLETGKSMIRSSRFLSKCLPIKLVDFKPNLSSWTGY